MKNTLKFPVFFTTSVKSAQSAVKFPTPPVRPCPGGGDGIPKSLERNALARFPENLHFC
jgi:hypothetical protein